MTRLIAATGSGLFQLALDGATWQSSPLLEGHALRCLASDARDPARLFAGSHGEGVWRSTNGGQRWQRLNFPENDVFSLAVSPVEDAVYVGTEPSRLFVSHDNGENWQELEALGQIPSKPSWSFPPRPWTSHVRWIAPSPHDAALLLVGIELGGVMRSDDGGQTFRDHPPDAEKDVHCLTWHPLEPGRAYEAGGGGTAWSHDAGATWQRTDEGRDRDYCWGLAVDPGDADLWYISACPGPRHAHRDDHPAEAAMYRWRGEGPWQRIGAGLPEPLDSMPYALVASPSGLYAALRNGQVFRSLDAGENWAELNIAGAAPPHIMAMVLFDE